MTDILLATFDSERFLAAQLDSLLAQTDYDWRLLVRDAGSTDATVEILARYAAKDPRIVTIPGGSSGARGSFAALLAASTAPYSMFCDHDDVWMADKVERSIGRLKELEKSLPAGMPALVFTDAVVTDESLAELSPSFFARSHLDPSRIVPNELVFQNVAPGCSMAFNAALREKALPIPETAVMHDHWMMLVASVFGRIECIREPSFLYRQHGDNVLGSPKVGARYFLRRLAQGRAAQRARLYANVRQARAFAERFGGEAPECLHAAGRLDEMGFFARRAAIVRHGLFKCGIMRNIGTLFVV